MSNRQNSNKLNSDQPKQPSNEPLNEQANNNGAWQGRDRYGNQVIVSQSLSEAIEEFNKMGAPGDVSFSRVPDPNETSEFGGVDIQELDQEVDSAEK